MASNSSRSMLGIEAASEVGESDFQMIWAGRDMRPTDAMLLLLLLIVPAGAAGAITQR